MNQRLQTSSLDEALHWLLIREVATEHQEQPYGDLTTLNRGGTILETVGASALRDIVDDYLGLLGTSAAVYEVNGDYAHGIFASGWCRRLDARSRELAGESNTEALANGKWHCHESCWTTSRTSIETRVETDLECHGGLRIFAVPILAGEEVIGSINFGYGDPPTDESKLAEIETLYSIDRAELQREAAAYETRPSYIVEFAKKRLRIAARLIGELVRQHRAEKALRESNENLEMTIRNRTKDLERTVRELTNANQELETFAHSIAHDLLGPLRAIEGFSRIVRDRYRERLDASGSDYLDRIRNGALRMAKMIDELLELSTVSRMELRAQRVDLSQLANEVAQELRSREPERSVDFDIDSGLSVYADPTLLRIAVEHLFDNAWKFTRKAAHPSIALIEENEADSFAVRDNGIGFDPLYATKLFQPFQRHHDDGAAIAGIGLATVERIARRHGGRLWAEATPGAGATFHVMLHAEKG